jgi:hypothetical protein
MTSIINFNKVNVDTLLIPQITSVNTGAQSLVPDIGSISYDKVAQILYYGNGATWVSSAGIPATPLTIGTSINAINNNGLTITGSVLQAQIANSIYSGILSNTTQQIKGEKEFLDSIRLARINMTNAGNNITIGDTANINNTGNFCVSIGGLSMNLSTGDKNTAVGYNSLNRNAGGECNTALGYNSVFTNTNGDYNTGIGCDSLSNNNGHRGVGLGYRSLYNNNNGDDNIALGYTALESNTNGNGNIGIGSSSLFSCVNGDYNIGIGINALASTNGANNISIGNNSMQNSTGSSSIGIGFESLFNSTGNGLTAVGFNSLRANTSGIQNTGVGYQALRTNITGNGNTGVGYNVLTLNTSRDNTAVGNLSMANNTSGFFNTALGSNSLISNTTGFSNVSIGYLACFTNSVGGNNIGIGVQALGLATGSNNVAVGHNSLLVATTGTNTAVGYRAGKAIIGGTNNTIIGNDAGINVQSGSNNILIGNNAGNSYVSTESGNICIGKTGSIGESNTTTIENIRFGTIGSTVVTVFIDNGGRLGTTSSIRAKKDNIVNIDEELNKTIVASFIPRRFTFKSDPDGVLSYGLIVDEVEGFCPDLIARDLDGIPTSIFYQHIPILLLTEIQRMNKVIEAMELRLTAGGL